MFDKIKEIFTGDKNEAKESFDSSMKDDDLIVQIKRWEEESEEFYGLLKRIWEKNLAYYHGIQTDSDRIQGKNSKTVDNRIWMAVETMIPIASARLPDIIIKPGEESDLSQINALQTQDVLNYHMDRVGIQSISERFIRDMLVKRYGVMKPCWDFRNDDVGVKYVDARRIRVPKFGTSIDELPFVIEDMEMTYDRVLEFFGESKANELIKSVKQEPKSDKKIRKATYLIQEVWTNDYVCWKAGNIVLDKKKNPYYDFNDLKKNYFNAPKKPYIIKSLFETDESIIGDTDYVQQVISLQDNINTRKRQIEDITNKVGNPYLLIDSDTMSEEEAANITNEPGAIIYGRDAASGTKIRFETPGQVPAYMFSDLEFSIKDFDNIFGIHSTTRGEREGKETLGGRQILREADMGRIDQVARQFERALDELANYWIQLMKLFYTEEKAFTILGEDGIRFVNDFTGDKIGNVKPLVRLGSTIKEDEASIKQNAILLWQNKAIGLRTLYKMLRIPNMQEAVNDFIETQSGQILRPAQPVQEPVGQTVPQPEIPIA
jgi:hypothetical protein